MMVIVSFLCVCWIFEMQEKVKKRRNERDMFLKKGFQNNKTKKKLNDWHCVKLNKNKVFFQLCLLYFFLLATE